tara:strand:+ start:2819 stop:3592 length:774 start_codon:yes stop_codon:yes gene_type:complete
MELYFCISLQRSGNTLLGSILNQNPDITFTANSPLTEIIYQLDLIKNQKDLKLSQHQNFPHNESLENVIRKTFYTYSETFKTKYVINRANWGSDGNLELLEKYFDKKIKFLIIYRDPLECLASLLKAYKVKKEDSETAADHYMNVETGTLGNAISQIPFVRKNYEHLFITYDQLIANPKNTANSIYDFFNIPKFKHTYKNLKQFEIQGVQYDDSIFGDVDLHTIRTDKIEKKPYPIEDFLLPSVINKYKSIGKNYES